MDRLHRSDEWNQSLDRNGWTDAYLTGDEFTTFVREESVGWKQCSTISD